METSRFLLRRPSSRDSDRSIAMLLARRVQRQSRKETSYGNGPVYWMSVEIITFKKLGFFSRLLGLFFLLKYSFRRAMLQLEFGESKPEESQSEQSITETRKATSCSSETLKSNAQRPGRGRMPRFEPRQSLEKSFIVTSSASSTSVQFRELTSSLRSFVFAFDQHQICLLSDVSLPREVCMYPTMVHDLISLAVQYSECALSICLLILGPGTILAGQHRCLLESGLVAQDQIGRRAGAGCLLRHLSCPQRTNRTC